MNRFQLRFPITELQRIAAAYDIKKWGDDGIEPLGRAARERGYYTRAELLALCAWKTPRSRPRCEANDEEFIREVTRIALSTRVERLRIEVLTLLQGVEWPTASVLLHFGRGDLYPILDYRALWSLQVEPPKAGYDFEFWREYTKSCRELARKAEVDMRTLDRRCGSTQGRNQGTRR
jgi:hypothetical protein